VPCKGTDGTAARTIDTSFIRNSLIGARIDVAEVTRYSAAASQNMLDKLLDGGHITPSEYIKRLPIGLLMDRSALIEDIEKRMTDASKEEYYA
jgi:hypothetical protein